MITDPENKTSGEYKFMTLMGDSICCNSLFIRSNDRGVWRKEQNDIDLGIRIIMNVTDMKKLMESNHDH